MRIVAPRRRKYYHPRNRKPPLQIGYMISLLEKEYKIDFLDGSITSLSLDFLLKRTKDFNPSIVVMDFTAKDRQFVLEYAAKIKEFSPYIKTICVGSDASISPENLTFENPPIDFVLRGECELDLVILLRCFSSSENLKKIRSLYFKEKPQAEIALVDDLDRLPMPKHSLFKPEHYFSIYPLALNSKLRWGYVLTSRGCPHRCTFCSPAIRNSYGSKIRFRSVENVVKEMSYLKSLGINIISFEDDNFTTSKEYTLKLCREMIDRQLGLAWIAHAGIVELSKELMAAMKKAGCILLKVGVESGSNRIIDILSKTEKKINWSERTQEVFKESKEINLPLHAMFIIGNPEETEADLNLTINLIRKIRPESIQIHYFVPYPGSKAFEQYCHNRKFNNEAHHYNSSNIINLSKINTKKLQKTQRHIYRVFYLNLLFIIKHILKYWRFYFHNPRVAKKGIRGLI